MRKVPLVILGVTALLCSRAMFAFFNDPEGPNLLIVVVMAGIIYSVSAAAYFYTPKTIIGLKKLLLAIFIQIVLVGGLSFCLN